MKALPPLYAKVPICDLCKQCGITTPAAFERHNLRWAEFLDARSGKKITFCKYHAEVNCQNPTGWPIYEGPQPTYEEKVLMELL